MSIEVAGSLIPGTVNTPLDQRVRIDTLADVSEIEIPFIGMKFYCMETGKTYTVKSLKEKKIGSFAVQEAMADECVPDPTMADLDLKLDAAKVGQPEGAASLDKAGKVPLEQLPDLASKIPSTISLPVPADMNGDNITLLVDFSENGIFTDPEEDSGVSASYVRVTMADHWQKMRVFSNGEWENVTGPSLGIPFYESTVEFTLDSEMFPGYIPGKKYYARYAWIDSNGGFDDWTGFSFSGDVADMRPIKGSTANPMKILDKGQLAGNLEFDWLEGEVQHCSLTGDSVIRLENLVNVPFGEALIIYVAIEDSALTVVNEERSHIFAETGRTYAVIASNFGKLLLSVTETI